MNKVYFIAPLLALAVFIAVHASHRGDKIQRDQARAAATAAALQSKREAEQAARQAAMAEAIRSAETRRVEKAAREAREKADLAARQLALEARDQAFRTQEKSARQIERLKKDIETAQAALTKLAAERQTAETENAFLVDFVTKAQTNVQALQALLGKLSAPVPAPAAK